MSRRLGFDCPPRRASGPRGRTPWAALCTTLVAAAACVAVYAALCAVLLAPAPARAGEAPALAADPALEARVNRLADALRCLVCQNQTVADSHSGLANDLKRQIREQLRAGRSEAQVLDYMVERFGDFVLYRPPVKASTWLLWAGPFVLLLAAAALLWRALGRQRHAAAAATLDAHQRARAAALLDGPG